MIDKISKVALSEIGRQRRTPLAMLTIYENGETGSKKHRVITGKYLSSFNLDLTKPLVEVQQELIKNLPQWLKNNIETVQEELGHDVNLNKIGVTYSTLGSLEIMGIGMGSLGWLSIEDHDPDLDKSISHEMSFTLANARQNPLFKLANLSKKLFTQQPKQNHAPSQLEELLLQAKQRSFSYLETSKQYYSKILTGQNHRAKRLEKFILGVEQCLSEITTDNFKEKVKQALESIQAAKADFTDDKDSVPHLSAHYICQEAIEEAEKHGKQLEVIFSDQHYS